MNKISDYVFRQLFPNFNLRPVEHVLFPSHPFFLKADAEEKDGIFTFSLKQPGQEIISVRFRLCYKVDRASLAAGVLVAYLQLIDRDIDLIQAIIRANVIDFQPDTTVFSGYKLHSITHECPMVTNEKELEGPLRAYGFHELYPPMSEKLKGIDNLRIKCLTVIEVYGFHEFIGIIEASVPYLKDGMVYDEWISAIQIKDPEDQSSSYAFANKILNPPLVNK